MATWFCKENVKWLHKLPLNIHLQRPTTVFGHITSTQWQRCVALSLSSHCATKNSEWSLTSISYHIISQKKTFHWFLAPSSNWPVFLFSSMWTGIYCSEHQVLLFWTGTSTVTAENTLLVQEITVLGKTCASSALQAVLKVNREICSLCVLTCSALCIGWADWIFTRSYPCNCEFCCLWWFFLNMPCYINWGLSLCSKKKSF